MLAQGEEDTGRLLQSTAIREHDLESSEPRSARRYEKEPKPVPMCREVTLAAVKLPSPDAVSGWNHPFRGDPAGVLLNQGPRSRLPPCRAPPAAIARAERCRPQFNVTLTPRVVCSWSRRLEKPALPVMRVQSSRIRQAGRSLE